MIRHYVNRHLIISFHHNLNPKKKNLENNKNSDNSPQTMNMAKEDAR